MMCRKFIKYLIILFFHYSASHECIKKDYGHGSFVCVCNSTYCDTVEPYDKMPHGEYVIYTSSKDGLRLKKSTGKFEQKKKLHTEETVIINLDLLYQEMNGFGGAFTDAAGYNLKSLNEGARNNLLRSYFSKNGIEYSLCRVPIGCSDLSLNYYSYNEVKNDSTLSHFNLTKEDFDYKIPFMKEAFKLSNNTLRFFGSAWTAPVWMKTNNQPAGYGLLKQEYYQTWADYHIKFLDAYKKEGINFWAITTGNEPIVGITPFFDITSLGWFPWDQGRWIEQNLGPSIRNNSQFKNTKIITVDDERLILPWWLIAETFGNRANEYIDGIGVHWYTDPWFPSLLTITHMLYPSKFLLGTEACTGDKRYKIKVLLGSWHRGEQYVEDIIDDVEHWVTGWVDWNMAVNVVGGPSYIKNYVDSSIIVNATAQEFYKQPTFYTMGHFSKFIPPGSSKMWIDFDGRVNLKIVAFLRPDKGIVIIVYNRHEKNKTISITDGRSGYINLNIQKRSISTILYWL